MDETDAEAADTPDELDLAHLRDLLGLLREFKVQAFQGGNVAVTFVEESEEARIEADLTATEVENENRTTSGRPVGGFKSPVLWPATNGKRLNFFGALTD